MILAKTALYRTQQTTSSVACTIDWPGNRNRFASLSARPESGQNAGSVRLRQHVLLLLKAWLHAVFMSHHLHTPLTSVARGITLLILQDERLTIMESHVFLTTQVTAPAQRPPMLACIAAQFGQNDGVLHGSFWAEICTTKQLVIRWAGDALHRSRQAVHISSVHAMPSRSALNTTREADQSTCEPSLFPLATVSLCSGGWWRPFLLAADRVRATAQIPASATTVRPSTSYA